MVATSDAHYLTQDDYLAHDVLLCINTGKTLDQPLDKPRFVADDGKLSNQFHVRSPEEMYSFLPGMDETLAIWRGLPRESRRTTAAWPGQAAVSLVSSTRGEKCGEVPARTLRARPAQALRRSTAALGPGAAGTRAGCDPAHGVRIVFSDRLGLRRYARECGIPAPRPRFGLRHLVSYVLHLSHVCPIKYDLLFERFLDPSRSEAPDIDIDLARSGDTRSSTTSGRSTATPTWPRSAPSAR